MPSSGRYGTVASFCFAVLVVGQLVSGAEKSCKLTSSINDCDKNERCFQTTVDQAVCRCLDGYEKLSNGCVFVGSNFSDEPIAAKSDSKSSSGGSSVAAGLLIPTCLIALAAVLFFAGRRYQWLQRLRQYRQNRYGNVLVTRDDDDDDDDPPIA